MSINTDRERRRFSFKAVETTPEYVTSECFMNQRVGSIGFVTKRRHGYCYGRTLDQVLGYTKTRRQAAMDLADLRERLIAQEVSRA